MRELVRSAAVREDRQLSRARARRRRGLGQGRARLRREGRHRRPRGQGHGQVERQEGDRADRPLPGRRQRRARRQEGRRPDRARARGQGRGAEGARPRPRSRRRPAGRRRARRDRPARGGARRVARPRQRPLPQDRRPDVEGRRQGARGLGAQGARGVPGRAGAPQGRRRGDRGARRDPAAGVRAVQGDQAQGRRGRRAALPRAARPLRLRLGLRRLLRRRHGRRGDPRAPAARGPRQPRARPARDDQDLQGPAPAARDQAPQGRVGVPRVRQQAGLDGARRDPGHPAGAAPDGAARRRPLRDQRPQRPLPARDQPQQPPQAAARSGRARDHRQQREADAAGGRRRALRQRPPRPRRHGPGQPAPEVALRHAQGQAGPLPPEPARQARRLLRPLGDRVGPDAQAAPVRPAQADGARALQAVHHEPARRAQGRAEHQGGQEDGRLDGARGLGRPRGGHRRAPGAAQPRTDAPPPGHPGLRADPGRGQGHPGPPARLPRLQRRLRRRPDGGAPAALGRGAGRGAHPHALEQQHPLAGTRQAAGDADAGSGHRHLLPDLLARRGPRVDRARQGRPAAPLRLGRRRLAGRLRGRARAAGDRSGSAARRRSRSSSRPPAA